MANADIARQLQHVPLMKHITHEAIALSDMKPAVAVSNDAGRILATML